MVLTMEKFSPPFLAVPSPRPREKRPEIVSATTSLTISKTRSPIVLQVRRCHWCRHCLVSPRKSSFDDLSEPEMGLLRLTSPEPGPLSPAGRRPRWRGSCSCSPRPPPPSQSAPGCWGCPSRSGGSPHLSEREELWGGRTGLDWNIYFLFLRPVSASSDLVLHLQPLLGAGAGKAAAQQEGEGQQVRSLHLENWELESRKSLWQLPTVDCQHQWRDITPTGYSVTILIHHDFTPSHHPSDLQCRGHLQWRVSCPGAHRDTMDPTSSSSSQPDTPAGVSEAGSTTRSALHHHNTFLRHNTALQQSTACRS